jgi:hypothetical protein
METMRKLKNSLIVCAAVLATLAGAGAAEAQIVTTVTVVNNSTTTLSFNSPSGQILGTVNPNPPPSIASNSQTTFTVNSGNPSIAAIHFNYESGAASGCHFNTSFLSSTGFLASASSLGGGFTCSAGTISSQPNLDYSITFTVN